GGRAGGLEAALKETRKQHRVERWQGGKEAALEGLGERMIGMVGALRCATAVPEVRDLVPGSGLRREPLGEVLGLLCHIEAIEAVKEGEAIALIQEKELPGPRRVGPAARRHRFNQHHA